MLDKNWIMIFYVFCIGGKKAVVKKEEDDSEDSQPEDSQKGKWENMRATLHVFCDWHLTPMLLSSRRLYIQPAWGRADQLLTELQQSELWQAEASA